MRRLLAVCGLVVLLGAGLLLASCGSDDSDAGDTTPTATSSTQTVTATLTTTTVTPPPPAGPTEIRIAVVSGAPEGGIVREAVERNDRVVLVVTSDAGDHVHLHGYDVMRDVAPGKPARLPFKATIPGRFEVELEGRGVQIADITVNP